MVTVKNGHVHGWFVRLGPRNGMTNPNSALSILIIHTFGCDFSRRIKKVINSAACKTLYSYDQRKQVIGSRNKTKNNFVYSLSTHPYVLIPNLTHKKYKMKKLVKPKKVKKKKLKFLKKKKTSQQAQRKRRKMSKPELKRLIELMNEDWFVH